MDSVSHSSPHERTARLIHTANEDSAYCYACRWRSPGHYSMHGTLSIEASSLTPEALDPYVVQPMPRVLGILPCDSECH